MEHSTSVFPALDLSVLGDAGTIDAFLAEQMATGAHGREDNEALAGALGRLPPARAGKLLSAILTHNAAAQPVGCAGLLARCTDPSADHATLLRPAGLALLESLPGDAPGVRVDADGYRREAPMPGMVVDLLSALERIDPSLAGRAFEVRLSHPATYAIDGVLLPAALRLHEAKDTHRHASVHVQRAAVLAHLHGRIAEPLEPPADWRRPSAIACTCAHCRELGRFLDDPTQSTWRFKAAEAERHHVEESIRGNRCDLDRITEKRGRPYTLLCTKNQASYQRRERQRRHDLEQRARLEGESGQGAPGTGAARGW